MNISVFYIYTANYSKYQKGQLSFTVSAESMSNKIIYERSLINTIKRTLKTSQFQSISEQKLITKKMSNILFQSSELQHIFRYLIRQQQRKVALSHKKLVKKTDKHLVVQQNIKRYIASIIKAEYAQSRSQKETEEESKTGCQRSKNMYLNSIKKIESKPSVKKIGNLKSGKQKSRQKDKFHKNILQSTNSLGHFLYGDKVESITDTYQIKSNDVDETICLVEWKPRSNGQIIKSSLVSIKDIQYYDPAVITNFLYGKGKLLKK